MKKKKSVEDFWSLEASGSNIEMNRAKSRYEWKGREPSLDL
ncbi:hypothetical protein CCACVL1_24873 [Corchorus capsularis]|uniref:Uncharacterized protein n=1 Tax=Corchorus capsularis TaxID=210143 RepID=A0A1R3GMW3_COCAP|nr:hypothetical protein CCACVL1_24873 [Corchorus capsularis]